MPQKTIASPFQTFSSVSVSGSASVGAATYTSSNTAIRYLDTVNYQVIFSGSPQGVLQVNASNNWNAQLPQTANPSGGSSPGGDWTTLASVSIATATSPVMFNLQQVGAAYIQCQFLSSTASGTLTGWVVGKSLGQ